MARLGLISCSPHLLNHSLISTWGHQVDKDRRGDPLLRLGGHCFSFWWGWDLDFPRKAEVPDIQASSTEPPKSLQMVTATMKLKDACSLEGKL